MARKIRKPVLEYFENRGVDLDSGDAPCPEEQRGKNISATAYADNDDRVHWSQEVGTIDHIRPQVRQLARVAIPARDHGRCVGIDVEVVLIDLRLRLDCHAPAERS